MFSVLPLLVLALVLQTPQDAPITTAPPAPVAAAPPARAATPADDPIGALVTAAERDNGEGEDGAPAGQPSQPRPPGLPAAPADGLPDGPRPYVSLPPTSNGVRQILAQPLVRLPPAPQGMLDGGWLLTQSGPGAALFQFQFNDEGGGGEIEGAWRDMRKPGLTSSGPVTSVGYEGAGVVIRFYEKGAAQMSMVTLTTAPGGGWTGRLEGPGGAVPVVMRRN